MEKLFKLIFTSENLRLVVLLVAMTCGFVWLNGKMDDRIDEVREELRQEIDVLRQEIAALRDELKQEIDELKREIDELRGEVRSIKTNDIAHLYGAIEALTFTMSKNGLLTAEDKAYIDSRLYARP